jgi:D-cysteine desulfhydrase
MEISYPPSLNLAQLPTPLQEMPRISKQFGCGHRLWVKRDDLTGSALSGNKVRKLEYTVAAALEQGCDTLITCGGVQSNHCRATALVGAQLGLAVHLVLRGEAPAEIDGNLLLDHLAGARISHYPVRQFATELDELLNQWREYYSAAGRKPWVIPTGASDGTGIWGYISASEELAADFGNLGIEQAQVICATGSGGTQAGLTLGLALQKLPVQVWGVNVCDDEAWFLSKVSADIADWHQRYAAVQDLPQLDIRVLDGYVGPGYGRATEEVFETISMAARLEGLVLDPVYTGKAFHGMLEQIKAGRFEACRDIVFIHTGGIFGVFPQRDQFLPSAS